MRLSTSVVPLTTLGFLAATVVAGPARPVAAAAPPAAYVAPVLHAVPALDHSPTVDPHTGWQSLPAARLLQIGGHRGGKDRAPENTLAAVRTAVSEGADAVELDVRFTSDGHPVILHDPTLERTTDCTGLVANWSLVDLAGCDAGSWFGAEFSGERVPTLTEVLDELTPTDVMLYPHVKLLATAGQATALVSTIAMSGLAHRQIVFVADRPVRLEVLSLAGVPRERLAWVVRRADDFSDRHPRWGALVVRDPEVTKAMVDRARSRGQRVIAVEGYPVTRAQADELGLDTFLADNLEAALAYGR